MNNNRIVRTALCGGVVAALLLPLSGCIVIVDRDSDHVSYGYSDRGGKRLGIEVDSVRSALAAQTGVMPGTGLVVTRVVPGSPAAAAGLQQYDVIKTVEGQPDGTLASLRAAIKSKQVGDPVQLTVVRGGQELTVTPTIASMRD